MARLLAIVLTGCALGVLLVAGIGLYGIKKAERDQAAAVIERQWADRRVGKNLPPTLQFWRDGYQTGLKLDSWGTDNRRALNAFLKDWQLFPAAPTLEGPPGIDPDAMDHIQRVHDRTKPQYIVAERSGCKVWINRPMAQEKVEWNGDCANGFASGQGVLFRKFIRYGQTVEAGFSGNLIEGQADGHGRSWLPSGHVYEGGHKAGQFHGHGELTMPSEDEVYSGSFSNGLPHGLGELKTLQQSYVGAWSKGCFVEGDVWAAALKHRYECLGGDHFEGVFSTLSDILQ
ncbi:MAG: hypothetical protein AAF557_20035 [Pseudomonadota bacterium]